MSDPTNRRRDLLPDAVLRYAAHEDGLADVHLPPSTPQLPTTAPATPHAGAGRTPLRVVVLVHGGFWKTAYDRTHTRPLARALADEGFVVVTPEYRRVGAGGAGGWPSTAQDVRQAVERLPELLEPVGVGVAEVQVVGHSAGGHLALWLCTTGLPVARTVALAPVADLRAAIRLGLGDGAALAFLGPDDLERKLAEADPMVLLDDRPGGEVTVVHGTRDENVPVELSRGLVQRHPWVRLLELPVAHFEPIDPDHGCFRAVLGALTAPAP